ncbi:glycosyltransferase [Cesiribacter andamanensis]|uniref:Putative glycosyl transferase n=1 Tax=Cesiribacter andamanensis AMV16 TaxID=1279009 RepID=M7N4X2_9BACT|nr:glycosyltransferase [Cesiribacter andamanensis]EMR03703.1 putative glycosyl transferase [Cesiribacter andamanensis AMV16]
MQKPKATLYISYDGMTDPLGQSQVLPYLFGLAGAGYSIILVSAEKEENFRQHQASIAALIREKGGERLQWEPLRYHKRPPVLSTLWDIGAMYRQVQRLLKRYDVQLLHCRSYISALIGLRVKRRFGIPFLFDMRGFWVEERVEGGLWKLENPLYRQVYRFFKQKEREFFKEAAAVVSLTEAGKAIIRENRWTSAPIEVIPCCADLDFFSYERVSETDKAAARQTLGVQAGDRIVSYLGSLGTWYMLDEMLDFFAVLLAAHPRYTFLFITKDDPRQVYSAARQKGIDPTKIKVVAASRQEVPVLACLSDFSVFFIRPSFSKQASSPTKHAELLGLGIPVFCNAGVGDTDAVTRAVHPGLLIPALDSETFSQSIARLPEILAMPRESLRLVAQEQYSLTEGVEKYKTLYHALLKRI